jgi:hypothetical protein
VPPTGGGGDARCTDHGFSAHIRVHSKSRMRRVSVFVDGKLLKRTTRKDFSVWVAGAGLRSGRNRIRVVAVDVHGKRDVSSAKFRRCEPAVPSPQFTG